MCGIIGAVTERSIAPILLKGLSRLEYRGYDSAGIVIIDANQHFQCRKVLGPVENLKRLVENEPLSGHTGLAHTRWATHGKPSIANTHPHIVNNEIALVHNGIIENDAILRSNLLFKHYELKSETDSELVACLVYDYIQSGQDFLTAVKSAAAELEGAYSIGLIRNVEPGRIIAVRNGSPLVIGLGSKGNYIASDKMALVSVAKQFIYLEDGDIADISLNNIAIYDVNGEQVERSIHTANPNQTIASKGDYPHFMLKEIFEQPETAAAALEGRITQDSVLIDAFGVKAKEIFAQIKRVKIVACGTSFHAGLVGRYWLEEIAGIPCQVEIASENSYRIAVIEPDTLFVTLSQSGETADTLSACRKAKKSGYAATLAICNVPDSTLCRESDLVLMTHAGLEIGVASTKSFTSQLVALLLLTIGLGRHHKIDKCKEAELIQHLKTLPKKMQEALLLDADIQTLAKKFTHTQNVLFVSRDIQFPIALEGALKLKEISYIHAEAYRKLPL